MKTLYLARHAQAATPPNTKDFARPLTDKGLADAEFCGSMLASNWNAPDAIFSSSAARAHATAECLSKQWTDSPAIEYREDLYYHGVSALQACLFEASDAANAILVVSHNPAISQFTQELSGTYIALSPADIAVLQTEAESWAEFTATGGRLLEHIRPASR